jgi:GR25 family glycosyltransferase involved in LPS biosynthesis
MNLFEHTLFINLDKRIDRRIRVQKHLQELGIQNAERFVAISTANGAIGCSMSHIKCLELAKSRGWEQVFICEDDFLCKNKTVFLESVRKFQENHKRDRIEWDVLLIGGNNCPPYYNEANVDYCVQITNCQTTVSYVVKKSFYDVLIMNMREGVQQLIREPARKKDFALDIYWKRLQASGRWFLLTPLTITQDVSHSDIEQCTANYDHLMLDLDKEWLFTQRTQQMVLQNMVCFKQKQFFHT